MDDNEAEKVEVITIWNYLKKKSPKELEELDEILGIDRLTDKQKKKLLKEQTKELKRIFKRRKKQ